VATSVPIALHKRVGNIKFRVDPGITGYPIEINKNCISLHAGNQRTELVRKTGCFAAV